MQPETARPEEGLRKRSASKSRLEGLSFKTPLRQAQRLLRTNGTAVDHDPHFASIGVSGDVEVPSFDCFTPSERAI
jgi:hypothetical protein